MPAILGIFPALSHDSGQTAPHRIRRRVLFPDGLLVRRAANGVFQGEAQSGDYANESALAQGSDWGDQGGRRGQPLCLPPLLFEPVAFAQGPAFLPSKTGGGRAAAPPGNVVADGLPAGRNPVDSQRRGLGNSQPWWGGDKAV